MTLIRTLITGTTDPATNITTFSPRPTGALAVVTVAPSGASVGVSQAALNGPGTPTASYPIAILLADTPLYLLGDPPIIPWAEYAITGDWNATGVDTTVYVPGITTRRWHAVGCILDSNNEPQAVQVDVARGTYAPYAGGGPAGTARDPYDVDAAKRKDVVDANVPAYAEADPDYYGKEFVDEVYGPGQPAYYKCMPSAPAATGGATLWKWFRIDIL